MALSDDGRTFAASAIESPDDDDGPGYFGVYQWNGTDWAQLGNDVDGVSQGDAFGYGLAMSGDGETVAAGGYYHSHTGGSYAQAQGHVQVYR